MATRPFGHPVARCDLSGVASGIGSAVEIRSPARARRSSLISQASAGRHTYGSHFVMGGGSIEKLQAILGHASVTTSERYAHLRPDHLRPSDLPALAVSLSREGGAVIDMAAHWGTANHGVTTDAVDGEGTDSVSSDSH